MDKETVTLLQQLIIEGSKRADLICDASENCRECSYKEGICRYQIIAEYLASHGVTVQDLDGCEYCKEDNEGYRKMIGAFSITNPFHGNVWNIETRHCKPRQIYFCPMCGRRLEGA